jgi:hypothetical protein
VTTIAYLDCVGGLAGDMLLGALLDAGAPVATLDEVIAALGLHDHVRIVTERVQRGAIGATQVRVIETDPGTGRRASELIAIVSAAPLPAVVRGRSIDALSRIANVEASIHDADPADVHLHELGGLDTLLDVCGAFALVHALGIDRLVCSPLPYARGTVGTLHGPLPAPGPATLELLRGASLLGTDAGDELVTPTGAAIVSVAADGWGELPALTLDDFLHIHFHDLIDDFHDLIAVRAGHRQPQNLGVVRIKFLQPRDRLVGGDVHVQARRGQLGRVHITQDLQRDHTGRAHILCVRNRERPRRYIAVHRQGAAAATRRRRDRLDIRIRHHRGRAHAGRHDG